MIRCIHLKFSPNVYCLYFFRYIASLSDDENKLIQNLGYKVLLLHQEHMVISPWSLMAAVLVQNKDGIKIKQLEKEVEWIKRQATNLGAYIDWPGECLNSSFSHTQKKIRKK